MIAPCCYWGGGAAKFPIMEKAEKKTCWPFWIGGACFHYIELPPAPLTTDVIDISGADASRKKKKKKKDRKNLALRLDVKR